MDKQEFQGFLVEILNPGGIFSRAAVRHKSWAGLMKCLQLCLSDSAAIKVTNGGEEWGCWKLSTAEGKKKTKNNPQNHAEGNLLAMKNHQQERGNLIQPG